MAKMKKESIDIYVFDDARLDGARTIMYDKRLKRKSIYGRRKSYRFWNKIGTKIG